MSNSFQFSRSFIDGALTTAASPWPHAGLNDPNIRSPVTPRRPSKLTGDGDGEQSQNGAVVDTGASTTSLLKNSPYLSTPSNLYKPSIEQHRYSADPKSNSVYDNNEAATSNTSLLTPMSVTPFMPTTPQTLHSGNVTSNNFEEGKLGTFSAINIILGKTVGVGVYSVPSSIFVGVGSVGMSILMWVLGALISFCGLAVYLDLGTGLPRSGGERVYLERIFTNPRMLATCMFMAYVVLLGFSTPNCIVLGEYVMYAIGVDVNRWNVRSLAVIVITLLCLIHARQPKVGLHIINLLGVGKMLILVIVILAGIAGMAMSVGRPQSSSDISSRRLDFVTDPTYSLSTAERNFSNIWAGSSTQPYNYATALLKVLYCFRGYSTANQVLSSVRRPVQTLQTAAPIALALVAAGYILANIAYFLAVEKDDFRASGVVVAGHFFKNVFGVTLGERILPCFVVVSAFGNIAATSFAQARVNEELGRDGLLPFASFWHVKGGDGDGNTADSDPPPPPTRGLFLHWLVSVLVIVIPPPGEIYTFLVDIGGYPVSVISVAISLGLLYLQTTPREHWHSPYTARKIYITIFAASNCLLLVLPWIRPHEEKGDGSKLLFPYYAYPATSLAILGTGVIYWVWWAKIRPGLMNLGLTTASTDVNRGSGRGHKLRTSDTPRMALAMRRMKSYKQRMSKRHGSGSDDDEGVGLLTQTSSPLLEGETEMRPSGSWLESELDRVEGQGMGGSNSVRRRAPCGCPLAHTHERQKVQQSTVSPGPQVGDSRGDE